MVQVETNKSLNIKYKKCQNIPNSNLMRQSHRGVFCLPNKENKN